MFASRHRLWYLTPNLDVGLEASLKIGITFDVEGNSKIDVSSFDELPLVLETFFFFLYDSWEILRF